MRELGINPLDCHSRERGNPVIPNASGSPPPRGRRTPRGFARGSRPFRTANLFLTLLCLSFGYSCIPNPSVGGEGEPCSSKGTCLEGLSCDEASWTCITPSDAGLDAGSRDAGWRDAGKKDAGPDTGHPQGDGGRDAGDSGVTDAGPDTGVDAATDTGLDTGVEDAGDAGVAADGGYMYHPLGTYDSASGTGTSQGYIYKSVTGSTAGPKWCVGSVCFQTGQPFNTGEK